MSLFFSIVCSYASSPFCKKLKGDRIAEIFLQYFLSLLSIAICNSLSLVSFGSGYGREGKERKRKTERLCVCVCACVRYSHRPSSIKNGMK